MIIINGICLMPPQLSYKVVNLAGKILCYAPKPTYKSVRNQLSSIVNFRDRNTVDFAIRIIDRENNEISVVFKELKGFEHIPDDKLYSNVLIINGYAFSTIPPSIEYLTQLIYLKISDLGLIQLPYNIGKLTNLLVLDISCNKLTDLPMSLKKLKKLSTLTLNYNQFPKVPRVVMKIASLRILKIYRMTGCYTSQYSDLTSALIRTNQSLKIYDY